MKLLVAILILIGRVVTSGQSPLRPSESLGTTEGQGSVVGGQFSEMQLPTSIPTSSPVVQGASDSSWMYPGARVISDSGRLVLEVTGDVGVVTKWYEAKINERGYGAVSFVRNTVNGEVTNKLVADGEGGGVSVEISRRADSESIEVKVTSY